MERNIVSLAQEAHDALEKGTRKDESEFYRFKKEAPRWMDDLAKAAHGGMSPDDERYRLLAKVLGGIAELDEDTDPDDVFDLLYDDCSTFEPDVYYSDLLNWVASAKSTRPGYVDEAMEEYFQACAPNHFTLHTPKPPEFYNMLGRGQSLELQEIARQVIDFLSDML